MPSHTFTQFVIEDATVDPQTLSFTQSGNLHTLSTVVVAPSIGATAAAAISVDAVGTVSGSNPNPSQRFISLPGISFICHLPPADVTAAIPADATITAVVLSIVHTWETGTLVKTNCPGATASIVGQLTNSPGLGESLADPVPGPHSVTHVVTVNQGLPLDRDTFLLFYAGAGGNDITFFASWNSNGTGFDTSAASYEADHAFSMSLAVTYTAAPVDVPVVGAGGIEISGAASFRRGRGVVGAGGLAVAGAAGAGFAATTGFTPAELHLNQWGLEAFSLESNLEEHLS